MKYIKTYENYTFELEDKPLYWYINGSKKQIIEVLNKIDSNITNPPTNLQHIIKSLKDLFYEDIIGMIIDYDPSETNHFGWFSIHSTSDFEEAKTYYKNFNAKFLGELKIKNNELFLDEYLVDIEKYNL